MASGKESASLKVITDVFAGVISDLLYRRSDNTVGSATVLERLALKKSSNVKSAAILALTSTPASTRLLNTETPVV